MKTFLIIGAASGQVPIIRKVKEMGHKTLVVSRAGPYPGLPEADLSLPIDVFDTSAIVSAAKEHKVSAVLTCQSELLLRVAASVAEELRLPGIPPSVLARIGDKATLREHCRLRGVETPKYWHVGSLSAFLDILRNVEESLVVKPVDNAGSKGVQFIPAPRNIDPCQAEKIYSESIQFSSLKQLIVEEFITGQEVVVEGAVLNGKVTPLMIGESWNIEFPGIFVPSRRFFPAAISDDAVRSIYEIDALIYHGLGEFFSVTQSEYIISARNGQIYLIDAHLRGGGACIESHIIPLVTGLDAQEKVVLSALGLRIDIPRSLTVRQHAGYVTFLLPRGRLLDALDPGGVEGIPGVHYHGLRGLTAGREIPESKNKSARFGPIVIHGDSRKDLYQTRDTLKATIKLRVETNRGICGPHWE